MDNRQNSIFKINNILISANIDDEYTSGLIAQNGKILADNKNLNKDYIKEFKKIKSGEKIKAPTEAPPSEAAALAYMSQNKCALAFGEYLRLLKSEPDNIEFIKQLCSNLLVLKGYTVILDYFFDKLEPYKDTDNKVLGILSGALYSSQEHYDDAIPFFEKMVEVYPEDSSAWFNLAFCTERTYQDKYLDKQIEYTKKSLEYSPDDSAILAFLGRLLFRNGQTEESRECFEKMMKCKPNPEDVVVYSRFLLKTGELTKGYDMHRIRFDTGIIAYPKLLTWDKRWDGEKDLSDSTVIAHYEQGFGDSVMFSRYLPELSKRAKKVIFVVQKNLIPLFKSSGYDKYCEILSHEADVNPNIELENTNRSVMYSNGKGMGMIEHDYHIPLMDLPYLMKESTDKMAQAGGYLKSDKDKIAEFREKYINKNNKFKIGLAYHGTKDSILTYRDISVHKFLPLLKMDGVEFYSFQSDKYAQELQELDKSINIVDLGKVFKDFGDTAAAMNCMDLTITTDNVIMNLGGALGLKTFVLFNKYTEARWYKTEGEDVGWYKSVKPFHAKTFNDWDNLIIEVKKEVEELLRQSD